MFCLRMCVLVISVMEERYDIMSQVSTQLKQYHDDLLAACLELILALPDEIVITHLNVVILSLQVRLLPHLLYLVLTLTSSCPHCRCFNAGSEQLNYSVVSEIFVETQ